MKLIQLFHELFHYTSGNVEKSILIDKLCFKLHFFGINFNITSCCVFVANNLLLLCLNARLKILLTCIKIIADSKEICNKKKKWLMKRNYKYLDESKKKWMITLSFLDLMKYYILYWRNAISKDICECRRKNS